MNNNIIIIVIIISIFVILFNSSCEKEYFSDCKADSLYGCPVKKDLNFNFDYYNPVINVEPKKLDIPTTYKYVNIGCYYDRVERAIPFKIATVDSLCQAYQIANQYGAPVFGLQNGDMYIGFDPIKAVSFGLSNGSCNSLGDSWRNQVYVTPLILNEPTNYIYNYQGCFLDSLEHQIPILIGRVCDIENAAIIANYFGATVFGIQNGGDLYIGFDIVRAKLLGPSTIECCALGGKNSNQVYSVF
jgi:hypothetical protein